MIHVVERNLGHLPGGIEAQNHRHRIGTLAARNRQINVLRDRVHFDVVDQDLIFRCAEQRGNFLVDAFDFDGAADGAALLSLVSMATMAAAGGIADEEDAVRSERERARRI